MSLEVANTIRQQIGHSALFMIGAKNLVGSDDSLSFRIGRNSANVNAIYIRLDGDDTYTVEFLKLRGTDRKVAHKAIGVYTDQLHATIKAHTGMETELPRVIFR